MRIPRYVAPTRQSASRSAKGGIEVLNDFEQTAPPDVIA